MVGAEAARGVRAPAALTSVHRRVMAGLDLYQLAASRIVEALESGDREQVERGFETVIQARQSFADAQRELERFMRERNA
jgi:hypothetical protein